LGVFSNKFFKGVVKLGKTIYVGNLQWQTTEDELKDFFSPHGQVASTDIIMDKETGRSRGFAFVTMENADEAMQALNGKELRGRTLKLNTAREKSTRSFSSENRTGGRY